MNITIETFQVDTHTKDIIINDGKNTLTITKKKEGLDTTITIQSNGDSIYPIMDLLKILEAVS